MAMLTAAKGKLIGLIGDEDTCVGFLLGGIGDSNKTKIPILNFFAVNKNTTVQDLEDAFRALVKRGDIDIILINQNIAEMIRHVIDAHKLPIPAVLEIPSKDHPYDANKDSIMRRAKGLFSAEDYRMSPATNRGLQYTFAMLKPDVANNSMAREQILNVIARYGFQVVRIKKTKMSITEAESFYSEHQKKFFFQRLITFMSSQPIYAIVLAKSDAISSWRSLIGKANVYRTIYSDPNCLRSQYGLTDTRNAVHGSDSEATAQREASFFFPEFSSGISPEKREFRSDENKSRR